MTIEEILETDATKLLAMSDEELLAFMEEPLKLEPRLTAEQLAEKKKKPAKKKRQTKREKLNAQADALEKELDDLLSL